MERIELKHLTPYLPYKLKCQFVVDMREDFEWQDWVEDIQIFNKGAIWQYAGYAEGDLCIPLGEGDFNGFLIRKGHTYASLNKEIKPILRPLSDLTKEIEVNGKNFIPMNMFARPIQDEFHSIIDERTDNDFKDLNYCIVEYLFRLHFDVFGLIESGLAIDINTLKDK